MSRSEKSMAHVKKQKKNKFGIDEDNKLISLVELVGVKTWKLIGSMMEGRTARQCRERYKYYLQPRLLNDDWCDEEDNLLLNKFEEFGPNWAKISQFFICRTNISVRNRYRVLERKMVREQKIKKLHIEASPDFESYNIAVDANILFGNQSKLIINFPSPISQFCI